ncbi:unnamed protein product [Phytophthora fragariaefolia]|uniref:Unnamed protein product n=1 Tax=Phytophthora fragariaefolia TaxID=1490495 RepID=A0A9W7CZG2_9STRA|nr:unnamed protein product [Phytophthora fragariaefolia]
MNWSSRIEVDIDSTWWPMCLARLDFDEELLPEDSWEPDSLAGEYEVESILDDRRPMETSTRRSVREFQVKWVGYDEPTWEPMTNLSCGGLLYDYLREKRSSQRFQVVQVAERTRNLHENGLRVRMYSLPCRRSYCTMIA